jgi:hypothetical protein
MTSTKKIVAVIVVVVVIAAGGVYLGLKTTDNGFKPAPDLDSGLFTIAEFSGIELNEKTERSLISAFSAEIMPYKGGKYDKVNISVTRNSENYDLRVICFSDECEYPDVYDFTYCDAEKELILNGYLLEAIRQTDRAGAISVALLNGEAVNLLRANDLGSVMPTVRRVLPDTAEKFYLPKTLVSVTWTKFGENPVVVSVLVDLDEGKAVSVWSNVG